MPTSGSRMVAVELDEAPAAGPSEPPRRRPSRRAALWLGLAAGAVAAALVVTQGVLDRGERRRLDELADVRGLLQPVATPVRALWHLGGGREVLTDVPVAGRVVAVRDAGGWGAPAGTDLSHPSLVGYDVRTGDEAWRTPFPLDDADAVAVATGAPSVSRVRCVALRQARLLCALTNARLVGTRTAVVDGIDGRVVATRPLPPDAAWTTSGAALVVATSAPGPDPADVVWRVTATDASSGEVLWDARTPVVRRVDRVVPGSRDVDSSALLSARDGRVLLVHSAHLWVLDGGRLVRDAGVGVDGFAELGPGGTVVWQPVSQPADIPGALLTADGRRVRVHETLLDPTVDDSTARDLVFLTDTVRSGALVVRDRGTGTVRWQADGLTGGPVVLDGSVTVGTGTGARSYDAATGELRWTAVTGERAAYVGTDGRSIVVLTTDGTLHGLDLDDGAPRWQVDASRVLPAPAGALGQVTAWDGHLLLRGLDGSATLLAAG
ncbi:PQQ-binding-like beta-propeller repeat protein [Cellulomonas sp. DKR-3]|uniref:PQQ-binding-like beta-propeller repeat protein n=1 Tax=Cellulomonas fulva TaxID=2835530 RepID=A0ABS5TVJ5_9CELL|nr:PQQ-binding-like beta-propeller repeat protein [Cellulomonas fulva]MBT0993160.1 PQQ-binding-like beta-propeller repeat protein [Cellulomonas fulva]